MQVTELGCERRDEWDAFARQAPAFALLQSCAWGDFKERLGWRAVRIAVQDQGRIVAGAQVLTKPLILGLASIAYVPRGPLGCWLDDEVMPQLFSAIHDVARRQHCVLLKLEPPVPENPAAAEALRKHGFQHSKHTNQPRSTIILDLAPDLDDLLKQMRKKTRQYIASAAREGITVRRGGPEDLQAFMDLMHRSAGREGFAPRLPVYYEAEYDTLANAGVMQLLMAYQGDDLLAVRTVCAFGNHAAEFHAGAERGAHLHPNYALVWEAIQWARAQGCQTYDFWGVPDQVGESVVAGDESHIPERTDGMWGVYRFKRGFSKNVICYLGAYDYVYVPVPSTAILDRLSSAPGLERLMVSLDHLRTRWPAPPPSRPSNTEARPASQHSEPGPNEAGR